MIRNMSMVFLILGLAIGLLVKEIFELYGVRDIIKKITILSIAVLLGFLLLNIIEYEFKNLWLNLCSEYFGVITIGALWEWMRSRREIQEKNRFKLITTNIIINCIKQIKYSLELLTKDNVQLRQLCLSRLNSCQTRLQLYTLYPPTRIDDYILNQISIIDTNIEKINGWLLDPSKKIDNQIYQKLIRESLKAVENLIEYCDSIKN